MDLQLVAAPVTAAEGEWLIVGVNEGSDLSGPLGELDKALGGQLTRMREAAGDEKADLTGKSGETIALRGVSGIAAKRVLLIGLGAADKITAASLEKAFVIAARQISTKATRRISLAIPTAGPADVTLAQRVQLAASSVQVGCLGQDLYKSEKKRFAFERVDLIVEPGTAVGDLKGALDRGRVVGEAINLARELVNLPAQDMYPESFANRAGQLAKEYGLSSHILDKAELEGEKMQSLLAVSSGSDRPPRVVMLEHNQAPAGAPVLALIGKGVTFDSGGLSLKPTDGMATMKCDMAGAAAVLATMVALARLKVPVHVRAYMGLVENMTGGSAMKLGDVLKSRSGVTIEVLNTDAEGRLVLADVLDYALTKGADALVDLATLTGACVVALGEDVVGAMSNNQPWCDKVLAAAKAAGEDMWQLPMFDHYAKLIDSDVADIKNTGGRWGGAISAAKFLERFVKEKPWVHLDIAGPAFASGDKPHREGGGTGCMVRTLVELTERFAQDPAPIQAGG
jgi:leucyl aminopeptidase